jgi:hypothetical protein
MANSQRQGQPRPNVFQIIYTAASQRTQVFLGNNADPALVTEINQIITLKTQSELNFYYNALVANIGQSNVGLAHLEENSQLFQMYIGKVGVVPNSASNPVQAAQMITVNNGVAGQAYSVSLVVPNQNPFNSISANGGTGGYLKKPVFNPLVDNLTLRTWALVGGVLPIEVDIVLHKNNVEVIRFNGVDNTFAEIDLTNSPDFDNITLEASGTPVVPSPTPPNVVEIVNTVSGSPSTRTQQFRFDGYALNAVIPNNIEIFAIVYSHTVLISSDGIKTLDTLLNDFVAAINATSAADWNDQGSAPAVGTPGFKPTAQRIIGQSIISLNLNTVNQFLVAATN